MTRGAVMPSPAAGARLRATDPPAPKLVMTLDPAIADLRRDYTLHGLLEADADANPFVQFRRWFDEALKAGLAEPNAMTLATVDAAGFPHARIVLLKGVTDEGFAFYTNFLSDKGRQLTAQPQCALVFLWHELERQVRIEGRAVVVPDAEADAYFASRPRASQIGAWASEQSAPVADREVLVQQEAATVARFGDGPIPRPPHWGGFRVQPAAIEFWQGRRSRLHDRLRYSREGETWLRERLSP